ncbi:MAG: hypothetical protein JF571_01565 [Asticcacaulis sp.]|nr:hypothetical protein [Asticcacaulis sp.]
MKQRGAASVKRLSALVGADSDTHSFALPILVEQDGELRQTEGEGDRDQHENAFNEFIAPRQYRRVAVAVTSGFVLCNFYGNGSLGRTGATVRQG